MIHVTEDSRESIEHLIYYSLTDYMFLQWLSLSLYFVWNIFLFVSGRSFPGTIFVHTGNDVITSTPAAAAVFLEKKIAEDPMSD